VAAERGGGGVLREQRGERVRGERGALERGPEPLHARGGGVGRAITTTKADALALRFGRQWLPPGAATGSRRGVGGGAAYDRRATRGAGLRIEIARRPLQHAAHVAHAEPRHARSP